MHTGASSFGVFCAGRTIGGYASGLVVSVCPGYTSEISPPSFRGRVGGLFAYVNHLLQFSSLIQIC